MDLHVLWQSVAELYAPRCEAKGLTLLIDAPHITVLADHDAVKQVILAFLENAVTHTPPGGTIRLFAAEVYVDSEAGRGSVFGFLLPVGDGAA